MLIEDHLLPPGTNIEKGHSLARLRAALTKALPSDKQPEAERAIGILQTINAIRSSYQHQERRGELPDAFARVGLAWPPASPSAAWDGIRARTIEALAVMREAVRGLDSHE